MVEYWLPKPVTMVQIHLALPQLWGTYKRKHKNFTQQVQYIKEVNMKATLKDVFLGTPAGKKAMEEALKKSCEDQVKLLNQARKVENE